MNRRRLLKALASAPGCFAGSAVSGLPSQPGALLGDTLLAFAEALLGSNAMSTDSREVLLEHLLLRLGPDSPLQAEYRACARLLDELAGAPFGTLSAKARHELLRSHGFLPRVAHELDAHETARDTRTFVVPDLIAAYYRSPPGWAAVGYTVAFPGHCAGLAEYTRTPT